ncbi:MAG TPA: lipoprotein insertase outer membrane protein LolB [Burkholderiales bacterium]|nr:lipoprotein insertase outer membrane protein LolB [Burkholderiales bacterium]
MRSRQRLGILVLAFVLNACASLPQDEAPLASDGFEVNGRVAVRYGQEAASGRVAWRHSGEKDDLLISNPLGQGIAELSRRDGVYMLRTAEGHEYKAPDPEALTEQALGWRLPLIGLPEWIRGRALSTAPAQRKMDGQRLATLDQLGWHIEYLAWDEARNLPQRLRLTRDDLDIRLAIEEWNTAP